MPGLLVLVKRAPQEFLGKRRCVDLDIPEIYIYLPIPSPKIAMRQGG
jgi:hypothetical protein